ncbi:MAG: xanthine dehydrogenase family protein molybdopterin-binding subunit [Hyphomonadaceae bacterium]|nr:xanthine dehydrogenase family protein molybdopterin-binding subunit [Hyphomonadaceae bacterium]
MSDAPKSPRLSRRALLVGGGLLVVSVGALAGPQLVSMLSAGQRPPLVPDELDSFIAIDRSGAVTAFAGVMDVGHGLTLALRQIVAEELDAPLARVAVVMGDTARTVNQGGASGSGGVQSCGMVLRSIAAEARRLLLERAAARFSVAVGDLTVADAIVSAGKRSVAYGDLVGEGYFNSKLEWNGEIGRRLQSKGQATPKSPSEYRIVGRSAPRDDLAPRVVGDFQYVTDVKVPGMLHGRMIRPPVAGAVPTSVDEASIAHLSSARIVRREGFLGVVAEREWDAIRASRELKVSWSNVESPFPPYDTLYDHIAAAPDVERTVEKSVGDVAAAFSRAARVVEARYEWPFQSHACMGPACAVVEIKNGRATVWTGTQKPHFAAEGVAAALEMPLDKVRAIWALGPGSYGRNDSGDAAIDAAFLAKAVGKPVRVQGMRHEGHGWDPKGPASVHTARAALDRNNRIIAYQILNKGFSRRDIEFNEAKLEHSLAGQLMGLPLLAAPAFSVQDEEYAFPNMELAWATIAPLLDRASPLRTAHLRDPCGPNNNFASESFFDEVALAAGADPIAFRLAHMTDERHMAVLRAAAERARWTPRRRPYRRASGGTLAGRGFAYSRGHGAIVAIIADVEVDARTGRVWPRRFTVAHECGQIINPSGLALCIEGNVVQAASRALFEEVTFDRNAVTSVDWATYPILEMPDAPEAIDIVTLDRPELPPGGAGEPATRPVAAALANAIFDATGVRLRRAPFSPARVLAALSGERRSTSPA